MSTFLVRFTTLPDHANSSVFGPFKDVEVVDDGERIKADDVTLARLFGGEWVPYPRPWEKWSEVSIEPHQTDSV